MGEIKYKVAHCGTATLETPRLILRRATLEDCQAIHNDLTTDRDIVEYVGWEECHGFDDTHKRVTKMLRDYDDPSVYNWLIIAKDCNEVAGMIYTSVLIDKRRTAEIDYCIAQRFRGKGYAPEAFKSVIHYLFFNAGFYRIEAQCNTDNPSSERVMIKAGMRHEGTMRGRAMRMNEDGFPDDILLYGITANDVGIEHHV